MGAFIARQPNGLYCRFSTVEGAITDYNMTEDDYIMMCVYKARFEAKQTLKLHTKPFQRVIDEFRPTNYTVEEFNEYLKEMGSDVQLDPKDYDYEED